MSRKGLQRRQILLRGPGGDLVTVAAPAICQKVVHPLDQHGGLAAAGACQEQQRPFCGHGGLTLHGVEPPQIPGDDRLPGGYETLLKLSHNFTSFL